MIARIADGDFIKIQQLYEYPIKALFNHLAYQIAGGLRTQSQK